MSLVIVGVIVNGVAAYCRVRVVVLVFFTESFTRTSTRRGTRRAE